MRIESPGSVAGNVTSQNASQTTAAAAAVVAKSSTSSEASGATPVDPFTGQIVLPKFPWITRLTLELEKNAQKSSPFEAAKIVGETIDKLA